MGPSLNARLRSAVVAVLFCTLGLAGCHGGVDSTGDDPLASDDSELNGRMGVDYSWSRPSPGWLRSAGFSFAARYLSHDSTKNISRGEADALRSAGVDIVANWE